MATAVLCALIPTSPASALGEERPAADREEATGLVVTRERGTSAREAQDLVADAVDGPTARSPVSPGVTAVAVPGLPVAAARELARDIAEAPGVESVGVDTRVHPAAVPNDPEFDRQWYLTDPLSGVSALPAWDLTSGSGQVVAVIDSGIVDHPDLPGSALPGYDFVTEPLVANDGDGRDADPTDPGDWVDADDRLDHPEVFGDCEPGDSSWHGTHVAGLIGAVRGNGEGIAGLAPAATILPVRALGKCGGTMSDIAAAITWAAGADVPGVPGNPRPADVINLSVSSSVTCQPFVQAAVDEAVRRGATVVAAAGNSSRVYTGTSPAGCYDVIAAGAATRTGDRATYSNYGTAGRDLPVFAPGGLKGTASSALLSTVDEGATVATGPGYGTSSGTSMAAALVSGAAALLRAETGMQPSAVAEHLRDTARPFPVGSNCQTGTCGAGLVDTDRALSIRPRLPGRLGSLTATAADNAIAIEWGPAADEGTAPVTGYAVEYRTPDGPWVPWPDPWGSLLRQRIITGVANDVAYQVRVAARNAFGVGPWSQSGFVTPMALPGGVEIQAVEYPTKKSVLLTLALPQGALTGLQYRLTRGRSVGDWQEVTPRTALRIRGLVKAARYNVEVRALNAVGAGPGDDLDVATPAKPSGVRDLRAKRLGKKLRIRWRVPARPGLRTRYRVRLKGRTPWTRTRKTELVVRGAPRARVRVDVQSISEAGRGPVRSIVKRK